MLFFFLRRSHDNDAASEAVAGLCKGENWPRHPAAPVAYVIQCGLVEVHLRRGPRVLLSQVQ